MLPDRITLSQSALCKHEMAENVLKIPQNEHDAHVFDKFVRIVSYMGMDALQKLQFCRKVQVMSIKMEIKIQMNITQPPNVLVNTFGG